LALAKFDRVRLPHDAGDIRMADVAHFGIAIEQARNWPAGSAIDALRRNRISAAAALVEFDPVAQAIRALLHRRRASTLPRDGIATLPTPVRPDERELPPEGRVAQERELQRRADAERVAYDRWREPQLSF
jgi:hypothetical protein